MKNYPKYRYPDPVPIKNRKWPDIQIEKAPVWCSVDLRDGNQALPVPMTPDQKLAYFKMLCRIGFTEIEVGFPSASQDDFDFARRLIEGNHVPPNVRISVLTQARRHLIEKTVESLKGASKFIIHCYVASSDLHGQIVFGKSRKDVMDMAVEGTRMIVETLKKNDMKKGAAYEFSPEEFTDADMNFIVKLCENVRNAWGRSRKRDFILNLPATVERRPPYQYADMIELFRRKYKYIRETTISLHAHNDQGCAVAATEMAMMAGGERVEGTLFGHGERTGNVDIVTLALNLHSRGIKPGLDFSELNTIARTVEEVSGIPVHKRHPYAGELVFTAFSGSHQDAIRKGIKEKKKASDIFKVGWKVPYLHIDPSDVGRKYERLIRINSQSGKGGAVYVLENEYGYTPPRNMHPEIGQAIQVFADNHKSEVSSAELLDVFKRTFFGVKGPYVLEKFRILQHSEDSENIKVCLSVIIKGKHLDIEGVGNGPVSAAVHGLAGNRDVVSFVLEDFSEQALGTTADATAVAYIGLRVGATKKVFFGGGEHSSIDQAAILAVFAALNRAANAGSNGFK